METAHAFPYQSKTNEFVNATTHGVGLVASCVGFIALLHASQDLPFVSSAGLLAYGLSLVAVYALSTLSHVVRAPNSKQRMRALDQGAIYLLISGTYTPLVIGFVPGTLMWLTLLTIWLAAATGCYAKLAAHHRVNKMTTWSYIALGWLPALAFIGHMPPQETFVWMALGGVSYSVGTLFLMYDQRINFLHAVWHVFVMIGSACHFYAIYQFAA